MPLWPSRALAPILGMGPGMPILGLGPVFQPRPSTNTESVEQPPQKYRRTLPAQGYKCGDPASSSTSDTDSDSASAAKEDVDAGYAGYMRMRINPVYGIRLRIRRFAAQNLRGQVRRVALGSTRPLQGVDAFYPQVHCLLL